MLKKLERLLPHAAILICNMYVVFYLIDRVNPAMNFIDNGLTKGLLLVLCAVALYDAWRLLRPAAGRGRAAARPAEPERRRPAEPGREGDYSARNRYPREDYRDYGSDYRDERRGYESDYRDDRRGYEPDYRDDRRGYEPDYREERRGYESDYREDDRGYDSPYRASSRDRSYDSPYRREGSSAPRRYATDSRTGVTRRSGAYGREGERQ